MALSHMSCEGRVSFASEALVPEKEITASIKGFLEEFQHAELNREIPIALLAYDSGTSMSSYSLDAFFDPSVFEDIDIVQAVTVEFS